jgi:hypothetical protein
MRHPTIDRSACEELLEQLVRGTVPSLHASVTWTGSGDDVDLRSLDEAVAPFRRAIADGSDIGDTEVFEGRLAAVIFPLLNGLPLDVLDDRGFWRYLALRHFWWYVAWREATPLANGNGLTYTDGKSSVMSIPARLFLRAQSVERDGDCSLAHRLERSTDFWRSHVLRVRVGSAPALSRSFVRLQADHKMKTDVLRQYAKRLNRTWTNVVLHVYDDDETNQLLSELHESIVLPPPVPG